MNNLHQWGGIGWVLQGAECIPERIKNGKYFIGENAQQKLKSSKSLKCYCGWSDHTSY